MAAGLRVRTARCGGGAGVGVPGPEGGNWLRLFSQRAPIGSSLGAGVAIGGGLAAREGLDRRRRRGTPGPVAGPWLYGVRCR